MLKHYLKSATSVLHRNRLFTVVNVLGLALGLASVLMIALFVRHELGFDRFHPGVDRLYRLSMDFDDGGYFWAGNAASLVPLIRESVPEIAESARLLPLQGPVSNGNDAFDERNMRLVDPEIFNLFHFEWVEGDAGHALDQPYTFVITQSIARKYFGSDSALGKILVMFSQYPMTVTGVIKDLPDNTHLSGDFFTSFATLESAFPGGADNGSFDYHSYVSLAPDVTINELQQQLDMLLASRLGERFQGRTKVRAVPVHDIHFAPLENELPGTPGSRLRLLAFTLIGFCILLIACVNFVNLSTARASARAREVGMRKVVGARQSQLLCQFMGESVLLAVLAGAIAVALVELLGQSAGNFFGVRTALNVGQEPVFVLLSAGLAVLVGVVAGIYPAVYLTRFQPVRVLHGDTTRVTTGPRFRNLLVICQFTVAITLIAATLVVYSQLRFSRNLDPGFSADNVIVVSGTGVERLGQQWETVREQLVAFPGVVNVTTSQTLPADINTQSANFWYGSGLSNLLINTMSVNFDFFQTYDVALLEGRDFDPRLLTDRMRGPVDSNPTGGAAYVLSEDAARRFGWTTGEAIGKTIAMGGENGIPGQVVGVVENIYYEPVSNARKPVVYFVNNNFSHVSIRISGDDPAGVLAHISDTFRRFAPGQPVTMNFLAQNISAMYRQEQQQAQSLGVFSLLAIFISCIGLFGLASFNAECRTREVGVRKVLGGSIWHIVLLLTNDFSRLVLAANVIAWPIAYVAMQHWLESFAYHVSLTPLVFIGSGFIALCVAWVTVGSTVAKAASRKPVLALRYE